LVLDQVSGEFEELYQRCIRAEVDYLALKPYSHHPQTKKKANCTEETKAQARGLFNTYRHKTTTPKVILREVPPPKNYTGCLAAGTAFLLICANGEVYPCAQFVGQEEWCMGQIKHQNFHEIKNSLKAQAVVTKLRKLDCRQCRHPCRCDAANRYLHRLLTPEPHDSFL
jgi:radical SAM protein with 4Fe4S-binding SPASM domain